MPTRFVDLSHPLSGRTPPFPGDPPVEIEILDATDRTDDGPREQLNCSRLHVGVHCGTHMDAPFHFFADGPTIDRVPLEVGVGLALVITLPEGQERIDVELLLPYEAELRDTQRVVFHTGWFRRWGQADYFAGHPVMTGAAARFLVACGVVLVGVDFPSVDRPPFPAHLALLGNGVVIVENLTNLDQLPDGRIWLAAIPLSIAGRDGSPVRAIAADPGPWPEGELPRLV